MDGYVGSIPTHSKALSNERRSAQKRDLTKEVMFHMKWAASIATAISGALLTLRTVHQFPAGPWLNYLHLVLLGAKALLLMAVGRPHPKLLKLTCVRSS